MSRQWYRTLPNQKTISALGFGCSSVWASTYFDETDAGDILAAALDGGMNHFDTGPSYGVGLGEHRLGQFLKGRSCADLCLTTKVGSNLIDGQVVRDFSPEIMQRSFDASLERLGVDHIDILYLHGPDVADLNDDVFIFFEKLKKEGRISYSGVNSFNSAVLNAVVDTPIDAVMLQYNVSDLSASPQIDQLYAAGKIILSATAMGRAKFTLSTFIPKNRASAWYLARMMRYEPSFLWKGPRIARRLAKIGKPLTDSAIQFVTGHPKILSSLFGTSNIQHLKNNASAGHGSLTEEEWNYLNKQ